jgi:hypothetical protein
LGSRVSPCALNGEAAQVNAIRIPKRVFTISPHGATLLSESRKV